MPDIAVANKSGVAADLQLDRAIEVALGTPVAIEPVG
jgi:hypothetical protein